MLKKFPFPPGINHQSTQYAANGFWYDCNNIRFRSGMVESLGGWTRDGSYSLDGFGRSSFTSRDYSGNNYQFVGTDRKYYAIAGLSVFDITPTRETGSESGSNLFTTVLVDSEKTALLSVKHASHGLSVNDWVVFSAVGAGSNNYTSALLTQDTGFQVFSVTDADNYVLYIVDETSGSEVVFDLGSATAFNNSFTYYYKVASGLSAQVSGAGFGAGSWGGDDYMPTSYSLDSAPVDSTDGSAVLKFDDTSTPVSVGEYVYLQDLSGDVGTGTSLKAGVPFDLTSMNDHWWRVSAKSTNDFSIDLTDLYGGSFSITGTEAGAGGSSGSFYKSVWTDGSESVTGATRGWGDSTTDAEDVGSIRRVFIDNYGEDIMFANSGGPIYYYDVSANTSNGVPESGPTSVAKDLDTFSGNVYPPQNVDSFLISKKDGHCVALGCNDIGDTTINSMLVRWSDQNNPFDWGPSATNTSGGQVLRDGSKIVGGVSTKDEVVIFTDASVYSMRFIGPPDTFAFNLITSGVGILGPRTAVNAANAVFFMGNDGFYIYTGAVEPLPCPVVNYVFDDFNRDQTDKCFGGVNAGFSEVYWFYPSQDSFEPDRYVVFNYEENIWYYGSLDMSALEEGGDSQSSAYSRTSWRDAIVFSSPMSTYITEYSPSTTLVPLIEKSGVMIHDSGTSANGSEISSHVESGDLDISYGENFVFVSRAIPDLQVFNADAGRTSASVTMDLYGRDFPGQASGSESSSSITFSFAGDSQGRNATYTPVGTSTAVRARARSISIRYASDSSGYQWRLGDSRFDVRPDGRR
jgi:hypothetical protein